MPSPLITVNFALPAGWVAPKNMVFAGPPPAGAARSIFAPQLPQKRLSDGDLGATVGAVSDGHGARAYSMCGRARSRRESPPSSVGLAGERLDGGAAHDRVLVVAGALQQRNTRGAEDRERIDGGDAPAPRVVARGRAPARSRSPAPRRAACRSGARRQATAAAAIGGRRIEGGGCDAGRRHAIVAELGQHTQGGRPGLGLGVVEQRGQFVG